MLGVNASAGGLLHAIKSSLTNVPNARSKTESQQMAEPKHVIGEPGGVDVVLLDLKF